MTTPASDAPCAPEAPRRLLRGDGAFPDVLLQVVPAVETLWVIGPDPRDERAIAIVGTRRATPYGLEIAHALGRDLALAGVAVVSGLAVGIDAAAHRGCLAAGGRTIAVLAGGVDVPMPPRNRRLYREIIAAGGSVVSEQPPGTSSFKGRYLERNRLIAGLCAATIVVQAGERSGARNTARWAVDLGRERFGVPGDIRAEVSRGVHAMIQEGAHVCTSARDVLAVLGWAGAPEVAAAALPREARRILALLARAPAVVDDLVRATGASPAAVLRLLGALELAGHVTRSGARYSLRL